MSGHHGRLRETMVSDGLGLWMMLFRQLGQVDKRRLTKLCSRANRLRMEQGGPGSVQFGYGSGMGRFERFRFSVPRVLLWKRFFLLQYCFKRKRQFRRFRFLFLSVPGKTVPTVPVADGRSPPI